MCVPLDPEADCKHFRVFTPLLYVYLLHTFRYTIHYLVFHYNKKKQLMPFRNITVFTSPQPSRKERELKKLSYTKNRLIQKE